MSSASIEMDSVRLASSSTAGSDWDITEKFMAASRSISRAPGLFSPPDSRFLAISARVIRSRAARIFSALASRSSISPGSGESLSTSASSASSSAASRSASGPEGTESRSSPASFNSR